MNHTASPDATSDHGSRADVLLDTTTANPARIYDAWLGGKDNFAADRDAAARVAQVAPFVVTGARANRAFLRRAVTVMAAAGIDQFLDLGAGLPGPSNVHEVARSINPDARVVYLDHDPVVIRHAQALLACDDGVIAVDGDLRDPQAVLTDPRILGHLDLSRPLGVLLVAVLHFVTDPHRASGIATVLRDTLTSGSYLAISHVADLAEGQDTEAPHHLAPATREAAALYAELAGDFTTRTPDEIAALFHGWELLPPGIVPANRWRPDRRTRAAAVPILAGVGRLEPGDAERIAEDQDVLPSP